MRHTCAAIPHLTALQYDVAETVNFAVLSGTEIVCIACIARGTPCPSILEVGSREPASCTSVQREILAWKPEV